MSFGLASPSGATLADGTGVGTITNNDVAGRSISGNRLANTITGTSGNDTIPAGQGNDSMSGLGGEDRFVFSRGDGFDRVRDFAAGLDDLVLRSVAASAVTVKAATYSGISGIDVSYGGTDHVFLERVALTSFSVASDVVFA